jgi:hypothetical protein
MYTDGMFNFKLGAGNMSRITFSVSSEDHCLIKAQAAMNGLTMKDYFLKLFKNANSYDIGDAIEELENPEKRKNLKTYKNSKELWQELGI